MATTIAPTGGTGVGVGGPAPPQLGGDGKGRPSPLPPRAHLLGMALALAGVSMLFIALTSAYIVRRGVGGDWESLPMPLLVPANAAVLLAGSLTLEIARRRLGSNRGGVQRWLSTTLLLGAAFIAGQIMTWRQLASGGIYLETNPHSSFFYTLTAIHGLHLVGGIAALAVLRWRGGSWGDGSRSPRQKRWLEATALYWHFMDGLWIYLVVLLFG